MNKSVANVGGLGVSTATHFVERSGKMEKAIVKMALAVAVALVFGMMFSTGTAQADLIDPSTITASSSHDWGTSYCANMVNNSGMSDSGGVHTVNFSTDLSKPTHSTGDRANDWITDQTVVTDVWVQFTFSAAQIISEFAVWNQSEDMAYQTMYIATQDATTLEWTNQIVPAGYTGAGTTTWTFAEGDASNSDPGGGFILSTNWTNVKAVRFTVQSNWGGPVLAGDLTLNEVRFYTPLASSVPEPAGLGLIGLALLAVRRRRA